MDINPDLSLLYRYQEVRRRLTACEQELASPEGKRALTELEKRVQKARLAVERVQKECTHLQMENRRLEGECRDYEAQLRDLETTLYSGKISAPKELAQLQKRMADYQAAKTEREEKILNQLYLLETKEHELAQAQKEAAALRTKLTAATEAEAQRVNALRTRCTALKDEAEALARALPDSLKEYFQRSAQALKGVVVTPIKDKTCGFCHMIIPPAVLEKVKKGHSGMMICENCGRGLFEQK